MRWYAQWVVSTCYVDMARQYKSMQTQMEMRIQFLEAEVKRLTAQLSECGWVARPYYVRMYVLFGTMWMYVRTYVCGFNLCVLYSSGCGAHDFRLVVHGSVAYVVVL